MAGLSSTMFSMGNVKTLPVASQARALTGSVGRTNTTGPETSVTTSADTQLSSFSTFSSSAAVAAAAGSPSAPALDAFLLLDPTAASPSSSRPSRFLFLGFLSPLNVRGLTIVGRCAQSSS